MEAEEEIIVFQTDDQQLASTCSLVLSAVQIGHRISWSENGYTILVAEEDKESAHHHLSSYLQENQNWPPPRDFPTQRPATLQPPTLLVIAGLMIFFYITGPWTPESAWFSGGAGNSTKILEDGEFYRLLTALTLHADLTHLLGNCFLGGFLLHFFCRITGPGIGLFFMTISATLANYINVLIRGNDHLFVGFSTAVFSVIGMLAMLNYHSRRKMSKIQLILPLMAGAGMLAMTGSSGERTDLGAHFFGLISGFFFGRILITDFFIGLRESHGFQFFLSLFTALFVFLCWDLAMQYVY